jgi:DNA-binding Lrp family transcriptional regulator
LVNRPFKYLAEKLETYEEKLIEKIKDLKKEGLIKEISALLEPRKFGLRNFLVGISVGKNAQERVARVINTHPVVSHNYLRKHRYNIWFTVAFRSEKDLRRWIKDLFPTNYTKDLLILPSLRRYKPDFGVKRIVGLPKRGKIFDRKISLLKELEKGIKIVRRPFDHLAKITGTQTSWLLSQIKKMKKDGTILKFGAMIDHKKFGFLENVMVTWYIPRKRLRESVKFITQFAEVSHCYLRPVLDRWRYNLYTVIHGKDKPSCERIIKNIREKIKPKDFQRLYTLKEYKKKRPKYLQNV